MSNDKPRCVYAFGFCGEGRSRLLDWFGRAIAFGFVEAIAVA
ncbi:hypothetical protein PQG02_28010 [Nostoc sp. UHCC 0926]|nr:hypothetical protein [Nostoc sp. UHCC 0926]WDD32457.1 hypothetical protein PQG02_28010 [Nostoc sp. UHCC 0926]